MPHCCQNHVIRYCEKVYERSGKKLFWSIKNSGEVLNKLKSRGFRVTSLSTYDFSTLYTTLPHNLIKEKLINLIEWTFKREGSPYIACNEIQVFFISGDTKRYKLWSCQNVYDTFWIILILDLALNYTDKLLVFRWVLLCFSCSWFVFILLWKRFHDVSFWR